MIFVYFLQVFTFKRFVPGGRVVAGLELVLNIQLFEVEELIETERRRRRNRAIYREAAQRGRERGLIR